MWATSVGSRFEVKLVKGSGLLDEGQDLNHPTDVVSFREVLDRSLRIHHARGQSLVRHFVVVQRHAQLHDIVDALRSPRGLAGGVNRRQKHRHEDADNGNHDQQLDQRKASASFARCGCTENDGRRS